MPITTEKIPMKIRIAVNILELLDRTLEDGRSASDLRHVGLSVPSSKPSERDAVMEGLRSTGAMEAFGGSGRGRRYRITPHGLALLASYKRLHYE